MLDPGKRPVLIQAIDLLGEVALVKRVVEVERQAARECLAHLAIDRELHHRQQRHRSGRLLGSLRLDVEPAQRIDRVADQLDANRLRRRRRKQIEDAATERELAGLADKIRPHESVLDQLLQQRMQIQLFALSQCDDASLKLLSQREALKQRARRNDQNVDRTIDEQAQRVNLFAHDTERRTDVLIWRE